MRGLYCLLILILPATGCIPSRPERPGPLSVEEALSTFQLHEDFRIEVFAAEPYVRDPVELVFDEDGRAFVAEMLDYPFDPPDGAPPKSRISLIEDTDGDGRVDRSTVFADRLQQVTSMQPWKGGLIVTAAPEILYLKDTDGDLRADVREVLFAGFALGVDPQSRITNLRFNIDNWIYAANNGQPGEITFSRRPELPAVSVLGGDFRFRLDRGRFEVASGPTQFGQTMNDWGHRFLTHNTIHVRHVVMPRRYLERNPSLFAGKAAEDISDHDLRMFQISDPQNWRVVRTRMRERRYRELDLDQTEHASGFFTGSSGGTIYTGDRFPSHYYGNRFTGEVAGNLVHRDLIRPEGVSFAASRASDEQHREFLASPDPWFRPCNFANAPDGNFYLIDMYREFVETPDAIPEDLKKEMDFYSGNRLGRIYRIVPKEAEPSKLVQPNLSAETTSRLVELLSHPNRWYRLTCQRLLVERQDQSAVSLLQETLTENDFAQARLHALYALEGLSGLGPDLVKRVLEDRHPGVREHAVRLAERFPELLSDLTKMIQDASDRVVFQTALSLGEFSSDAALTALASVAGRRVEDHWFQTAVLSSRMGSSARFLDALITETDFFERVSEEGEEFLRELAAVVGARNEPGEIERVLSLTVRSESLRKEAWQVAVLSGLSRGLDLAKVHSLRGAQATLKELLWNPSESVRSAAVEVARHFVIPDLVAASVDRALSSTLSLSERKNAIRLLAGAPFGKVRSTLDRLIESQLDQELMQAVLGTLESFEDPGARELIISRWKILGPAARDRALEILMTRRPSLSLLLQAVEEGRIEKAALDRQKRTRLIRHPEPEISERARRIFPDRPDEADQRIQVDRSVLKLNGEPVRGQQIFERECAPCHRPRQGPRVGPNLAGVKGHTKESLLEAILNPSKQIEPQYRDYIITTGDGRIYEGVIVGESPGMLRLFTGPGREETILRSQIEQIRVSSLSMMPEGLEETMSRQELADLIAFLQAGYLTE